MANPLIEVGTGESRLSKLLGTGEEINRLARDNGFVRRTPRKLAAEHFLAGLLQAAATGHRSLRWLALWCGLRCCQTVSRQNLFKRFSDKSNAFLQACVALVMTRASTGGMPEAFALLARRVAHPGGRLLCPAAATSNTKSVV